MEIEWLQDFVNCCGWLPPCTEKMMDGALPIRTAIATNLQGEAMRQTFVAKNLQSRMVYTTISGNIDDGFPMNRMKHLPISWDQAAMASDVTMSGSKEPLTCILNTILS
jgi:hypothetical protein